MSTELEGLRVFWDPSGSCGGWSIPRNISGAKVYLDFLKIDLNVATIIAVQYLKHRKTNVNGSRHNSVKVKSQADNIWVKDIVTT